jgi:hypothetical protein
VEEVISVVLFSVLVYHELLVFFWSSSVLVTAIVREVVNTVTPATQISFLHLYNCKFILVGAHLID